MNPKEARVLADQQLEKSIAEVNAALQRPDTPPALLSVERLGAIRFRFVTYDELDIEDADALFTHADALLAEVVRLTAERDRARATAVTLLAEADQALNLLLGGDAFDTRNHPVPAPVVADPDTEAKPECACTMTDPKTWTTYGDAAESGSQWEFDPECPAHGKPTSPAPITVPDVASFSDNGTSAPVTVRAGDLTAEHIGRLAMWVSRSGQGRTYRLFLTGPSEPYKDQLPHLVVIRAGAGYPEPADTLVTLLPEGGDNR